MPSRIAARLITGPLAFLLAGLLDICAFWVSLARRRLGGPHRP